MCGSHESLAKDTTNPNPKCLIVRGGDTNAPREDTLHTIDTKGMVATPVGEECVVRAPRLLSREKGPNVAPSDSAESYLGTTHAIIGGSLDGPEALS